MRKAVLLGSAGLLMVCSWAARAGDVAGQKLIACAPVTYEAAMDCLDRYLPDSSKQVLRSENGPAREHLGLGMLIRNYWIRHGRLGGAMADLGIENIESMSDALLRGYSARLNGKAFNMAAYIAEMREWEARGAALTPLPIAECADKGIPAEVIEACERDGNGFRITTIKPKAN